MQQATRTQKIGLAFLVTWGIVAVGGFAFPKSNNQFHIPIALNYFASKEGPHDAYTKSLENFASGFWILVSNIATESTIYQVFFSFFLCGLFMTVWAFMSLVSDHIWSQPNSVFGLALSTSVLLMPFMHQGSVLGRNEIIIDYLTHSEIVVPFILMALLFILRRNYYFAAALLGFSFNINAFVAIWMGCVCTLAMLAAEYGNSRRKCIRHSIVMAGLFIGTASPTLVWIFNIQLSTPPYRSFNFIGFLRDYYPYHTLVDVQPENVASAVQLVIWMWAAIFVATDTVKSHLRAAMKGIGLGLSGVLLVGMVLPYLTESRLFNNLYPLRMDAYVQWVMVFCIGTLLARNATSDNSPKDLQLGLWSTLINGNVMLGIFFLREFQSKSIRKFDFLLGVAGILAVTIIFVPGLQQPWLIGSPTPLWGIYLIGVLVQSLSMGLVAARTRQPIYFFAVSSLAWAPIFYLIDDKNTSWGLTILLLFGFASIHARRVRGMACIVNIVFPAILIIEGSQYRHVLLVVAAQLIFWISWLVYGHAIFQPKLQNWLKTIPLLLIIAIGGLGVVKVVNRGGFHKITVDQSELIQAEMWARASTAPNTLFLPIGINDFSTLSRRPIWVDDKQGAVAMWAPELYWMWSERFSAVKALNSLEATIQYATSNGIEFVVLRKGRFEDESRYKHLIAFSNATYQIYRIAI